MAEKAKGVKAVENLIGRNALSRYSNPSLNLNGGKKQAPRFGGACFFISVVINAE
ncbi:MAG: hypothetical protein Q8L73_07970 [Methylotenera sp.]|nr:hypothetical protein [Methylotenera sp.]